MSGAGLLSRDLLLRPVPFELLSTLRQVDRIADLEQPLLGDSAPDALSKESSGETFMASAKTVHAPMRRSIASCRGAVRGSGEA